MPHMDSVGGIREKSHDNEAAQASIETYDIKIWVSIESVALQYTVS